MAEKHRSVNNVLWRVVAGRIRRGRGPDAARGPPVGHPCCICFVFTYSFIHVCQVAAVCQTTLINKDADDDEFLL